MNLTSSVLKQENQNLLSFDNAVKALETIETTDFDFIITDIQMPIMDGFSFIEKLKNSTYSTYNNQPIIALTGRADLDFSVFTEAGFTTVIKKPYSPKVLLETIQQIIENKELPIIEINKDEEIQAEKMYSLKTLKQFLGDDQEGLSVFLNQFIESSKTNMIYLEKAVKGNKTSEINAIAHRIAPMFRQIEASEISEILKELEQNDLKSSDLENLLDSSKV